MWKSFASELREEWSEPVDERFGLKSSVENTLARCSYPELTMHSGSQLTCSSFVRKIGISMAIRRPIHRIGA